MSTIGFVVGSLRKDSINKALANALVKLLPSEYSAEFIEITNLPLYNQDNDDNLSDEVVKFKQQVVSCQAIIFVTPEYNRSIPGVLKNALDIGSRPYGQNVWQKKPAGIIGMSPGSIGTALAQKDLRGVLAFLNMPLLSQPEVYLQYKEGFFNANGNIANDSTEQYLQGWINAFIDWITTNK